MNKAEFDSGYSRRALARLALSVSAAELADQARALVHADRDSRPGEALEAALNLLGTAQLLVTQAAVLERSQGTSWQVLGECLDVSRQAAHQRFASAVEEWETAHAAADAARDALERIVARAP